MVRCGDSRRLLPSAADSTSRAKHPRVASPSVQSSKQTGGFLCSIPSTLCSIPSTLCSIPSTLCSISRTLCSIPSTLCSIPSTLCSSPSTLCSSPSTLCSTPSGARVTSLRRTDISRCPEPGTFIAGNRQRKTRPFTSFCTRHANKYCATTGRHRACAQRQKAYPRGCCGTRA